jgi:hypothetical protein
MEVWMFRSTPLKLIGMAGLLVLFSIGCELVDEPPIAPADDIELNTIITEGPADEADLLYGASPVFRWKGEVSPGYVAAYRYAFEEDTMSFDYHDWSTEMQVTFETLEAGEYYFAVQAMDDDDSVEATPAERHFTVLEPDSMAPAVRFLASPADSSYRSPGMSIFFEWTAADGSPFGSVEGYRYMLYSSDGGASATAWSDWSLEVTSVAFSNLQAGAYTFFVQAEDNSGEISDSSDAQITVTVKSPTVLVVDNYVPSASEFLNEIATDRIIAQIFEDWAWEEWDVATEGDYPTAADLAGYTTVVWYCDNNGGPFYEYMLDPTDPDYIDNPLDDYLDAGGNLWLMGGEVLYAAYVGHSTWGDWTISSETLATEDISDFPLEIGLANDLLYSGTYNMTLTLDEFGVIVDSTVYDTTFDAVVVDSVVSIDTSTVPVDTTWTTSGYNTTITDDGNDALVDASSNEVGSISYSGGSLDIDTLYTDLSSVDLVKFSGVATSYHCYNQYRHMFDTGFFPGDYLGVADGGDNASGEYTGLLSTGETGFGDIGIPGLATGTGWPDIIEAATAADAIYDLGGESAGDAGGVLYQAGTFNSVFFSVNFAFIATNHNHLTLEPHSREYFL